MTTARRCWSNMSPEERKGELVHENCLVRNRHNANAIIRLTLSHGKQEGIGNGSGKGGPTVLARRGYKTDEPPRKTRKQE